VQRPRIGRLGLAGAVAYAYSYVFFTSTVVYALIAGTPNYKDMTKVFGAWMTVHGLIMLAGGLAFSLAVARARVLPRWTGICLMAGVILVIAAAGLPNLARTAAAAVPDAAFIGMGLALLRRRLLAIGLAGTRHRGASTPRLVTAGTQGAATWRNCPRPSLLDAPALLSADITCHDSADDGPW
jgi:peptidoglycan/LPS O-acetylase OafA/YrhL